MIQFTRPPVAPTFDAEVRDHHDSIAKTARTKKRLEWQGRDVWKKFKSDFSVAQHRKCGYCESKTAASQDGDVEHIAPKGEVWALPDDERKWGVEAEKGLPRLKAGSRERTVVSKRGYGWTSICEP